MTTPYHAKYFAHELTQQVQPGGVDCLSMALFGACVDLNPHQIEGRRCSPCEAQRQERTLRRQVVEYIQYTEKIPFTVRFRLTDDEQKL